MESLLTADEIAVRDRVRAFAEEHLRPGAGEAWEAAEVRFDLLPKLAEVGIVGGMVTGYGCPGLSSVAYGMATAELARVDSSFSTFFAVHSSLVMCAIDLCGSEEQKRQWLPLLARCEKIACFALTEPDHGSDASHLTTSARRESDDYVLNGAKRWIGNATFADLALVWARAEEGVAGFLVELPNPGFKTTKIEGKIAKRSVWQADIRIEECRVPASCKMPVTGFRHVAEVLSRTRHNVAWAALGEAIACYEIALAYAQQREQFGKPIGSFQLVQEKLVKMVTEITKAQLLSVQLGRLKDLGQATPGMTALAKANNSATARFVAATAREILGGNGILNEYEVIRHMVDIEAVYTYEGTQDINTLVVGREITGLSAFL
ncbi:MAG: acyl-CoA dehydrogenase family protein [Thermomicrobiales bacterium]|nr:acyl-CoA dehydrogenase family protein [Thermomicrobiales bacterium]